MPFGRAAPVWSAWRPESWEPSAACTRARCPRTCSATHSRRGGFTVIQIWFFVQHGLVAGVAALDRAQVMTQGRSARWGTSLAASGMALLAVTELIAITARNSTYPGDGTGLLAALYGVSSLAVGVGLILAGIVVRRAGRWTGWRGQVVLVAGIFVFVPMTPALMGPFVLARLATTVWMLLFAALGYALWKADAR